MPKGGSIVRAILLGVESRFAGLGVECSRGSHMSLSFDIVIVGAGPAGLAAAFAAAGSGRRVAVLDDTPWLGGQIWRGEQARPSSAKARRWIDCFRRSGAALLDRTSAVAAPRPGVLLAEHPAGPREIHWQHLILATGAHELFLPFPGWTLPGVIGPGGLQALVKNGWPVAGRRIVVADSGLLLLAAADGMKQHGARIISICEQASWPQVLGFGRALLSHPGKVLQGAAIKLRLLGVSHRCGVWPLKAEGDEQVRCVTLTDGRRTWTEDCDLLACGFGLLPNVELPLALGCALNGSFVRVNEWQATSAENVYCAGEPGGIGGADCALTEGLIAGYAAGGQPAKAEALFRRRASWHTFRAAIAKAFALRSELKSLAAADTLICRCEDVTLGRMKQFNGWRDAKLQSRCSMGPCQGRICGAAAKFILGWDARSVRPPVLPARVGALISGEMQPLQTTTTN
jgi:NADPH-dependent 2,4-dienoyl-CoA reductase/sulfur reductase-like enzyme